MTNKGKHGRARLHEVLREAQQGLCYLCEKPLGERIADDGRVLVNLDHVWPKVRYDYALRGNCLLAHHDCNGAKRHRDPKRAEVEFLQRVNALLGWRRVPRDQHRENKAPWAHETPEAVTPRAAARKIPTKAELAARPACLSLLDEAVEALRTCRDGPDLGL